MRRWAFKAEKRGRGRRNPEVAIFEEVRELRPASCSARPAPGGDGRSKGPGTTKPRLPDSNTDYLELRINHKTATGLRATIAVLRVYQVGDHGTGARLRIQVSGGVTGDGTRRSRSWPPHWVSDMPSSHQDASRPRRACMPVGGTRVHPVRPSSASIFTWSDRRPRYRLSSRV